MDEICFPYDPRPLFGLRKNDCWIAYSHEKPIGYASGCQYLGKYYFLNRVGVLPEYRGNNLQKDLIEERIERAKSIDKVESIITYTSYENIPSIKNLKHCGFEVWEDPIKPFRKPDFIEWKLDIKSS